MSLIYVEVWRRNAVENLARHDINLSPHKSPCRCALYAPLIATQATHMKVTSRMANQIRIAAFHRQDTGAEEVNMMSFQRS
jgi:hypothetical protein